MLSASRTATTPSGPPASKREPHQRDVVQRVAELAGRDREEEPPEVAAPEQVQTP